MLFQLSLTLYLALATLCPFSKAQDQDAEVDEYCIVERDISGASRRPDNLEVQIMINQPAICDKMIFEAIGKVCWPKIRFDRSQGAHYVRGIQKSSTSCWARLQWWSDEGYLAMQCLNKELNVGCITPLSGPREKPLSCVRIRDLRRDLLLL